jgi:hypothetical protein
MCRSHVNIDRAALWARVVVAKYVMVEPIYGIRQSEQETRFDGDKLMSVKLSISLTDQQDAFALRWCRAASIPA